MSSRTAAFFAALFFCLGTLWGSVWYKALFEQSPAEALLYRDCAWYPIISEGTPEGVEQIIENSKEIAEERGLEIDYATERLGSREVRFAVAAEVCDSEALDEMEHGGSP